MNDRQKTSDEQTSSSMSGISTRVKESFNNMLLPCRLRLFSLRNLLSGNAKTMVGRILMYYLGWGLLVYFMAIGGLWWTSTSVMQDNLKLQAVQWLSKLDEISAPLYVSQDASQFEHIRKHISDFPEIAYLRYYTAKGDSVLGEYRSPLLNGMVIPGMGPERIRHLNKISNTDESYYLKNDTESSLVRVSAPLWVETMSSDGLLDFDLDSKVTKQINVIGYIDLGLDFKSYQEQLANNIIVGSLIIAVVFILVALLGRHLIRHALLPLTRLQEPLKRLANGENDVRVNVEGDEEIRAICNALNMTIAAVKDRDDKLNKLANYDSLTGLMNRHSFTVALYDERISVNRNNGSSALFFIDLDKFKCINDSLGHAAGDRLLKTISRLLKEKTRETDFVSRYGGDEFAIIVKNVSKDEAAKIAKALIRGAQELNVAEQGQVFEITFSIGLAMMEANSGSLDEIQSQADAACFQAKRDGRNCYRISDESRSMKKQNNIDEGWSERLKDAISENKFILQYQPIINMESGQADFHEVLLRLSDENDELIQPNAFLPTAERLGLSLEIDQWVIRNALAEIAVLRKRYKNICLSINLSAHSVENVDIAKFIEQQLAIHDLPASCLMLEIREQVAMRRIEHISECLNSLNRLGCLLAIDCFGSGFDSFNYLKEWPVDFVKINNLFIEKASQSSVDNIIVQSMVRVANSIGKKTIACHVSDEATLQALLEVGVDYAQGFYLGSTTSEIVDKNYDLPVLPAIENRIRSIH